MDEQEIKNRLIEKLLRGRFVGERNVTIDHLIATKAGLPSHLEGRARTVLEDEMIPAAEGSIARYGGQREAVHLTDAEEAIEYLTEHDGNVPFGLESD